MKTNKEVTKDTERGKKSIKHFNLEHLQEERYIENKKHSIKDKDLKSLKKSKSKKDKNDLSRFSGDGVNFKAKLIGTEVVNDARGDKMCQESLQKLKAAVKSSGEHKQRVTLNVSLNGIRMKDDKTGEIIQQHPVHKISFISQDAGDARAFGYVFGCPQTGHQFFAIKTEKAASQIVICLRDLFQVVLEMKKKEMEKAVQHQKECQEEAKKDEVNEETEPQVNNEVSAGSLVNDEIQSTPSTQNEDIKAENENSLDSIEIKDDRNSKQDDDSLLEDNESKPAVNENSIHNESIFQNSAVDNLLDLQVEMDTLQQGIEQMDSSIAAAASFGFGVSFSEDDNSVSSGNSFILTPRKLDSVTSSLQLETVSTSSRSSTSEYSIPTSELKQELENPPQIPVAESPSNSSQPVEDKYSVFADIESLPSIFDNPAANFELPNSFEVSPCNDEDAPIKEKEDNLEVDDNIEFSFYHDSDDLNADEEERLKPVNDVFAELDPLGKDHPYVDKEKFFQEIKNPPKKVLKDLIGEGSERRGSCPFAGSESLSNAIAFDDKIDPSSNPSPFKNTVNSNRSPPPPKLPPKRSFSVTSPIPCSPISKDSCFENNFEPVWEVLPIPSTNPFTSPCSSTNSLNTLPPSSPPPPPPPRLPMRVFDPVFKTPPSPPPRPPNRTVTTPTPPLPRRKPPMSNAGKAWYSFDQDASDHWHPSHIQLNSETKAFSSSPPIPAPSRKPPIPNRCESPLRNNMSPLHSPYFARRQLSRSPAFTDGESPTHLDSPSRACRKDDSLRNSSGLVNGSYSPSHHLSPEPQVSANSMNPFDSPHKSSSKPCLSTTVSSAFTAAPSPPLPPKSHAIPRPRPSPSKKMCSPSTTPVPCSSAMGNGNDVAGSINSFHSSSSTTSSNACFEEHCRPASVGSLSIDGNSDSDATSSNGYQILSSKESEENSSLQEKEIEPVIQSPTSPDSIFCRKSDPFADEFFTSLPKKSSTSSNQATSVVQNNCTFAHNNRFEEEFEVDWEKAKEPVYAKVDKTKKEDAT